MREPVESHDPDLSLRPHLYPGRPLAVSGLVTATGVHRLEPAGDGPASWVVAESTGLGGPAPLDQVLAVLGAAPVARRLPVVAVGSNSSATQLVRKFAAGSGGALPVPVTRARLGGVALSHSPHVSRLGYLPFVPVAARGGTPLACHVLWLDAAQCRILDATEPNYRRVLLSETQQVTLESGATLAGCAIYRGRWGALRWSPDGPPVAAGSQAVVFRGLAAWAWFVRLVPEASRGARAVATVLAADASRREAISHELASRRLAAPDGLNGLGV